MPVGCGPTAMILLLAAAAGATPVDDLAVVHARVLNGFYPTSVAEIESACHTAAKYASMLQPDGRWPDVKYNDTSRSVWLAFAHLERVQTMALALTVNGSAVVLHNASGTKAATLLALDWWLQRNPQNPNWWYNDIGVPMSLGETMLMAQVAAQPGSSRKPRSA